MGETPSPTLKDASLVNKFRKTAVITRRPDAWRETWQQIPQEDRGRDPIEAIIKLGASKRAGELTDGAIIDLADEYDELRQASGLDPSDESIDHLALVDFFLERKGIFKPQGAARKQPPGLTRRNFLRAGALAGGVAAAAWATNLVKPRIDLPLPSPQESSPALPEKPINLLGKLMKSFIEELQKRRGERAKNDQEFTHRVDQELNKDRVNFLLFGYGQEYTGNPTPYQFGSHTIVSYNQRLGTIDVVTLTHDIRAPEIERYLKNRGESPPATKIDRAFEVGGFDLARETLEDATGLSIDFQINMQDGFIKDFIDNILGTIIVDVPFDFDAEAFYLDGNLYPRIHYSKGQQTMDGLRALQFMKARATQADPDKVRNIRKHIVFDAIGKQIGNSIKGIGSKLKLGAFTQGQLFSARLKFDFNEKILLAPLIGTIGKDSFFEMPKINSKVFLVDGAVGDGGVQWVTADAVVNEITRKEIENGVYKDLAMEIPYDANPYAKDLVTEYWQSVRALVRQTLLTPFDLLFEH